MARRTRQTGAAVGIAVAIAAAGCGAAHTSSTSTSAPPVPRSTATASTRPAVVRAPRATVTAPPGIRHARGPSPGALPQTNRLPSSDTHEFAVRMHALWRAVLTGSVRTGLAAFFPEGAYAQVKAIAYPAADYEDRLLVDYRLDLEAAHVLLGAGAHTARLVAVQVPSAHWVPPQACYNRVGYYEVPNSRLVYRIGGQIRSIGIASMISWRGIWYVIHLGAVRRTATVGVIDAPSAGPGVSTPSATC